MKNKRIILDGKEPDLAEIRSFMDFAAFEKNLSRVKLQRTYFKAATGGFGILILAAIIYFAGFRQNYQAGEKTIVPQEKSEIKTVKNTLPIQNLTIPADTQKTNPSPKVDSNKIMNSVSRVDFTRNYKKFGSLTEYYKTREVETQRFTINASRDTVIQGSKGTLLEIKANSFTNLNELLVSGKIEFELKECYTPEDMLREKLTTMSGEKILESGGMIYMGAAQNGIPLKLKKYQEIALQNPFPEVTADSSMLLYYGEKSAAGDFDWRIDSCSRLPYPVSALTKGKYKDTALIEYFASNFRFDKKLMLDLLSSGDSVSLSVTLNELRKVIGHDGPDPLPGSALAEFIHLFETGRVPSVSEASWKTNFEFRIFSKQDFEKFLASYKEYVNENNINKGNFLFNIINDSTQGWRYQRDIARFYAGELGWCNFDKRMDNGRSLGELLSGSVNNLRVKRNDGSEEEITLVVKGSLLKGVSIIKPVKTEKAWIFTNIPVGKEATLTGIQFRDGYIYSASKKIKVKMKEPMHELDYNPQL